MAGSIVDSFFLIFSGAAIIASLALWGRQPLLVAYVVLGMVLGPYGTSTLTDTKLLSDIAEIGIIFLLFLLGLDMQPSALFHVLRKALTVTLVSSASFALIGFCIALLSGFTVPESLLIGATCMFSSTIIGIKLLPTTVLHHRHSGELMIGILLLQDFLAILVLIAMSTSRNGGEIDVTEQVTFVVIALPLLAATSYFFVQLVLLPLLRRFDRFQEYIFLVAVGWCLGMAELSKTLNLSAEIGAFIGGISLATSPIAQFISIRLKPLRDFFLVIFFFATGAQLNIHLLPAIALPVIALAAAMLVSKPVIFRFLLKAHHEKRPLAWDVSFRLGQNSEFSLLIAFMALSNQLISESAGLLIQSAAILSLLVSSYIVVFNFPNPIAVKDELRRD